MVQATLADQKMQTRQVVNSQPNLCHEGEPYWYVGGYRAWQYRGITDVLRMGTNTLVCPWQKGDRIWVRETWAITTPFDHMRYQDSGIEMGPVWYRADNFLRTDERSRADLTYGRGRWRPSIHMPRFASRLTLEITGIRIERLADISEADAAAEGVHTGGSSMGYKFTHRDRFEGLWGSIYGLKSWEENQWVWVRQFKRLTP